MDGTIQSLSALHDTPFTATGINVAVVGGATVGTYPLPNREVQGQEHRAVSEQRVLNGRKRSIAPPFNPAVRFCTALGAGASPSPPCLCEMLVALYILHLQAFQTPRLVFGSPSELPLCLFQLLVALRKKCGVPTFLSMDRATQRNTSAKLILPSSGSTLTQASGPYASWLRFWPKMNS